MTNLNAPEPSSVSPPAGQPGLRCERRGSTVVITFDRQAKLNAIDSGMKAALTAGIPIIARDPQVYAVLWCASPGRMFSAGGDIREFYDLAKADHTLAAAACGQEYALIWLLDCFSKPTIALIDGAVMGTGAGITQVLTHRVAGAGYRFQMPETAIGFFPDNGVARLLARLPHEIGVYLGLTGAAIGRADAYRLGIVTHAIDAGHFDEIARLIADAEPIDAVLDGLHEDPGPAPIDDVAGVIQHCFSAGSVAEIMHRLAMQREQSAWCDSTMATLAARAPLALAVTLEHIRRARHLDLRQTLTVDYRLAVKMVSAHDFLEGVKVRLIDKQGTPRWRPVLADIGPGLVSRLFDAIPGGELVLPTRQEMQSARV